MIQTHKDKLKKIVTHIAQSIWTDSDFVNYKIYMTPDLKLKTISEKDCEVTHSEWTLLFSYKDEISWCKKAVFNALSDREIYKIIDKHNHNIRLITEGYANLFMINAFDALQLCNITVNDYTKSMTRPIRKMSIEILKTFSQKFMEKNFDKIWNIILKNYTL